MAIDFHNLHKPGFVESIKPSVSGFANVTVKTTTGAHVTYKVATQPLNLLGHKSLQPKPHVDTA